jgi:hypothetical protein
MLYGLGGLGYYRDIRIEPLMWLDIYIRASVNSSADQLSRRRKIIAIMDVIIQGARKFGFI